MFAATSWYVARSAGIAAWLFLMATIVWGSVTAGRFARFHKPLHRWMVDLHPVLGALSVLLHSAPLPHDLRVPDTGRVVSLAALPGWVRPTPSFVARHPVIRRLYASLTEALFRAYFKRRWARKSASVRLA